MEEKRLVYLSGKGIAVNLSYGSKENRLLRKSLDTTGFLDCLQPVFSCADKKENVKFHPSPHTS